MDKCIGCHFYDRQNGSNTDSRGSPVGTVPALGAALHPVNQKSFMIEGVWPHVRDDDWCGEWKALAAPRRAARHADSMTPGPLLPIGTASVARGARPSNVAPFASGNARASSPSRSGPSMSGGERLRACPRDASTPRDQGYVPNSSWVRPGEGATMHPRCPRMIPPRRSPPALPSSRRTIVSRAR